MTYTEKEIEALKSMLKWRVDPDDFLCAMIKVDKDNHIIYEHEINLLINNQVHPIWSFLHSTPLEEVPLYVNTIPELARWRLMIAK